MNAIKNTTQRSSRYFPALFQQSCNGNPARKGVTAAAVMTNPIPASIVQRTCRQTTAAESVRLFGCAGITSRWRGSISNSGPLAFSDNPHNGIFDVAVTRTRVVSSRRCVTIAHQRAFCVERQITDADLRKIDLGFVRQNSNREEQRGDSDYNRPGADWAPRNAHGEEHTNSTAPQRIETGYLVTTLFIRGRRGKPGTEPGETRGTRGQGEPEGEPGDRRSVPRADFPTAPSLPTSLRTTGCSNSVPRHPAVPPRTSAL
jgi:hypothetical protein